LIATLQVSAAPLTALRGDANYVYVASADGALHVYQNKKPFYLVNTVPLSQFGLRSLALVLASGQGSRESTAGLYVSRGQAELAAYGGRVYLSELNEGEVGVEVAAGTFTAGQIYGNTFEQNTTVVFDRQTGQRLGAIPNPTNALGGYSQVSIYADPDIVAQTTPGCCGAGVVIRDAASLAVRQFLFAASSWGNDQSRSPFPPLLLCPRADQALARPGRSANLRTGIARQ
jgi:hypothetical protein